MNDRAPGTPSIEEWRRAAAKAAGAPERLVWRTPEGIDVKAQGWTELGVLGLSPDGTLLFGGGVHNDQFEGWVAEFPSGYLASFNPQPEPPSGTSIVGAWHTNDTESGSPTVSVFMADGTYFIIQPTVQSTEMNAAPGFERGLYTWDATGVFKVTTLTSTLGDVGLADGNGRSAVVQVVEDPAQQAPAVEAVVEVVRARLRPEQLQSAQDGERREGCGAHGPCLPRHVNGVKTLAGSSGQSFWRFHNHTMCRIAACFMFRVR